MHQLWWIQCTVSQLTDVLANAFPWQMLSGGSQLQEGNFLECRSSECSERHKAIWRNATGCAAVRARAKQCHSVQSRRPNLKTVSVCLFFFFFKQTIIASPYGTERHLRLGMLKLRHIVCLILNKGVQVSNSRSRTMTQSKLVYNLIHILWNTRERKRRKEREK